MGIFSHKHTFGKKVCRAGVYTSKQAEEKLDYFMVAVGLRRSLGDQP